MRLINSDSEVVDARVVASDSATANKNVLQVDVGSMVLLAISVLACVLAGVSFGFSVKASADAERAEREARILQIKVEGFENALWAAKIDPAPHLRGQPE